ncbi:MAG: efflux RND transporter periplasmic adaptor subunit [Deltaproteobacteria bacterium]
MKKNKKWIYIGIGIVVLLLIVAALIKGKSSTKPEIVTVEEVKERVIKEKVSGSGKVYPELEVKISSDVSGEIVKLYCKEGDSVKANQVLALVNPDTYESVLQRTKAGLDNSKAQLANARSMVMANKAQREQILAQLENARKIYTRNKTLHDQKVISDAELENAYSNMKSLEANLKSADANILSAEEGSRAAQYTVKSFEASLDEASKQLKKTTIISPIDGVITMLAVEEGERVVGTIQMAGTEMMRISNMKNMEVSVEISENDILKVKKGDTAVIEVDAYINKKFTGHVVEVANSASDISNAALNTDKVTNFIVKVRIDSKSYSDKALGSASFPFRPGMSATVDIFTSSVEKAISVPIQSVTTRPKDENKKETDDIDDLNEVVFVADKDTVKMMVVKTGIQDDEFIEIKEGLKPGQKVVTGPYNTISKDLKGGSKIKIEDKNDKKLKNKNKKEKDEDKE